MDMNREKNREKELDKVRKDYMEGKISPKEYIEKALTFKDGDSTRLKILEDLKPFLSKNSKI